MFNFSVHSMGSTALVSYYSEGIIYMVDWWLISIGYDYSSWTAGGWDSV